MIVLGIDASSDAAAAGIVADGKLLCEYTLNNGKNHSVKLLPMIEAMLSEAGLSFSDIDVYSCGVGPGSFTGVRIGVATAKGFAQSWNKPMVSLSSLQLLAENLCGYAGLRVPCIHARVDELFCAAYNADGEVVLPPSVMTVLELSDFLKDKTAMLCGDGALEYAEELMQKNPGVTLCDRPSAHVIRGGAAAELGYKFAAIGNTISCEAMEPVYLRLSQAEREYQARENGKNK